MRTIAIVFGDNDFGHTFEPLLETIHRVLVWRNGERYNMPETEEYVKDLIHSGIAFHYKAFQHKPGPGYPEIDRTVKYLSGIKILFDEEAEKDIQTQDHNSGAWYLDIGSGAVSFY